MESYWLGFIYGEWSLFLAGIILWGLIIVSVLSFIWGLWKKSGNAFLISGFAFLFPAIILATQGGWSILYLLLVLLAFYLSHYVKKES
ncbi:hypothetical protein [Neobacillus dielmonensis]|uniref:hypothetical protein n=1 Tax=Neobacillus dielmonensis TaxID=1347369 RepID=UPI0012B5E457|nr:hypothetical protein [Neobacillus dielmonensis]